MERSFTPQATPGTATTDATSTQLASAFAAASQGAGAQTVTFGNSPSAKSTLTLFPGGVGAAGTVNGKKEDDMNATLAMPDLATTTGASPSPAQTSADVHVLLGTNTDFHEAVEHIMHIAELSNLSTTSNPLRVAIEIQTPPGAIVNVYVSRQADSSYRAQLSTNDPQALGWVQDQIGALKGATTTGTDIRWAPAQLDSGTTSIANSSSSNGGNLDWNRGGNQSGNQPSDERPSRNRSSSATDEDEADLDIPFLETLGAMGGAA
jgi:hypothetical protein